MESVVISEHKKLVEELSEGMERAQQLQQHFSFMCPGGADAFHLQRIISCFENALVILNSGVQSGTVASVIMDSPASAAESSKSYDNKAVRHGDASKKRKLTGSRTEQLRVHSKNGLEGPSDDGYSWRKYGQKDILGAKYPRSYYRCTYRLSHNCLAMKQVQRTDDDPTVFEVTYKGTHSCNLERRSDPKPESLQKLPKSNKSHNYQLVQPNDKLLDMKSSLRVDTEAFNTTEVVTYDAFQYSAFAGLGETQYSPMPGLDDDSGMNSYSSQVFNSPVTPDSDTIHQMRNCGSMPFQSDDHVPTTTSESMIFPIYDVEADANILFDMMQFSQ